MIELLVIVLFFALNSDASHPGHLKAFGSSGIRLNIEEISQTFPLTSTFVNKHVRKSNPFIVRQVLNNQDNFDVWRTDDQLEREVHGLTRSRVRVDFLENGKRREKEIEFGQFVDRYQNERIILADFVPANLRKFLLVQAPLQCEPLLEAFQSALIVMSDRNSSPLLSSEIYDQLHCVYRGEKHLILVQSQTNPSLLQLVNKGDNNADDLFHFDPDRVDLDRFPSLIDSEFHLANLTSGDCLFVPAEWIFQERVFNSTITIIANIDHQQVLLIDEEQISFCEEKNYFDEHFSMDQIDWTNEKDPPNLRDLMIKLIKSRIQGLEKWQQIFSKHLAFDLSSDEEISTIFEEFYGIVDFDGDGEISIEEIEKITGAHQYHIGDLLTELSKKIHEKREENRSNKKNKDKSNQHGEL